MTRNKALDRAIRAVTVHLALWRTNRKKELDLD